MLPEDKAKFGNWQWRLQHFYRIKTKEAQLVQLKLNPVQTILAKYVPFWNYHLVLKARQEGVSTFFLLWHLDGTLFHPNTNTCILADRAENLQGLFDIVSLGYDTCPERVQLADGRIWEKPKAKYDSRYEMSFEGINSSIYVSLEVRSRTVHRLHVSEWAFIKHADKVLTSTFQAVPKTGIITGESTANGMAASFYDEWYNPDSRFMKHFFGFQDHPDYCDPVEDEKAFRESLTPEEKVYMTRPNMKLGNIAWMRRHLSIAANRKMFKQEYPCIPEEAFIASGRSPFDREKIMDWPIVKPIETKMEGRLKYWYRAKKDRRYLISVDCASGMGVENLSGTEGPEGGTDYSSIGVWDCVTLQKVAAFRGKWPYHDLHRIVYMMGREYNDAYIAIEATDHGLTVINNLVENVRITGDPYPQYMIHTTATEDTKTKKRQKKWGWYTNLKTKPLIIDHLAELIDEEEIKVYDQVAQSEFLKFIIDDKGKYGAMEGYHDDTVMESAIGLYLIPEALKAGRMTASKKELGLEGM